jgi:hypothetical protein
LVLFRIGKRTSRRVLTFPLREPGPPMFRITAEERFIEKLEQSPETTFPRQSEEENTRLRDALQQAAIVTNSLGA